MVIVTLTGEVVSEINQGKTLTGVDRVFFTVEAKEESSLPMHYQCVTFGGLAQRAANELRPGALITCFGRFTAGGAEKKINLAVSGFEVLSEGAHPNDN